jgi:hypothetical protein
MKIFIDKQAARRYVDLLVASQNAPIVFDMLVKDTWINVKKTLPGVRAEFLAALQDKHLFDVYMKRVKELGLLDE